MMMKLISLAAISAAILSPRLLVAQISGVSVLEGPKNWKYCYIDSPTFKGLCSHTIISAGGNTIDIHFLRWPGKPQGLTFMLEGESLETIRMRSFLLIAESIPGQERISEVTGRCSHGPREIYCASYDGRFTAKASATRP